MGCGCGKRARKALDIAEGNDNSLLARAVRGTLNPNRRITRKVRDHFEKVAGSFSDEGVVASQDKGQDNGDADHP